jgi:hypothetical protein
MPRNDPVTAALGGTLALTAALAAALGSRVAPSIFGAMIAFALAADAGLSALGERASLGYRALCLVLARWLLAAGWLAFAALLLHTPLAYPDTLRALITVLIGGEAARQIKHAPRSRRAGLALVLFWAAAAIAVSGSADASAAANPSRQSPQARPSSCSEPGAAGCQRVGRSWTKRRGQPDRPPIAIATSLCRCRRSLHHPSHRLQ